LRIHAVAARENPTERDDTALVTVDEHLHTSAACAKRHVVRPLRQDAQVVETDVLRIAAAYDEGGQAKMIA
jgi:hypothetical protein